MMPKQNDQQRLLVSQTRAYVVQSRRRACHSRLSSADAMMDAYDILRLVCEQERVAPGAVCRISQRRADAHARHLCWYLMHTCQGMRQSDIAAWFDVDRRAVAWGVSRVEDRRDDPDFDARLTAIEDKLAG